MSDAYNNIYKNQILRIEVMNKMELREYIARTESDIINDTSMDDKAGDIMMSSLLIAATNRLNELEQ